MGYGVQMLSCPACRGEQISRTRTVSAEQAAAHLIPEGRSSERNLALRRALGLLWDGRNVDMCLCASCGFGFTDPFIAGNSTVYNLIGAGAQHYPKDKFEFDVTLDAIASNGPVDRLLEIGAGSGAFLSQIRSQGLARRLAATEYDDSAVAALNRFGDIEAFVGDFRDYIDDLGSFDVVCLFEVLEHLADLDAAFDAFYQLLKPRGRLYIGVPNERRTDFQERVTGFLDMPPVHIGRWPRAAMDAIAARHGFDVTREETSAESELRRRVQMGLYRYAQRSQTAGTAASRIEGISFRPLRGVVKRAAATRDVASLVMSRAPVPPLVRWFELRRIN